MTKGYCNPLNLPYRFQLRGWSKECHREAADPSVVWFQDLYWLFPSKSGGYWYSRDLNEWTFIQSKELPIEDYAPDVCVIDGALLFTASRHPAQSTIYRSTNPIEDQWEEVSSPLPYTDPKLFQDEDGRVYLYAGCSNSEPIYGIEMDRHTLLPTGSKVELIHAAMEQHGWERTGDDNALAVSPWIEGAWMNKRADVYYLQYAAPGTEFNVYGDGVYTATSPLGPFTYSSSSPFSFKPGGFITGAGHGSTFEDRFGNFWHISTMRISIKHRFERRIGLFPAGFDEDGILYANTSFGDYPQRLPEGQWNPWSDSFSNWMLLSYKAAATASSALPGYPPEWAANEDIRTHWSACTGEPGEWLKLDLGFDHTIHAVQLNFAEQDCDQYGFEGEPLFHQYLLEGSNDGVLWRCLIDKSANRSDIPHDYVQLPEPTVARYVRLTNVHMPARGKFAVSGFRVFGRGAGAPPAALLPTVVRDASDGRNATLRWQSVPDYTGCNVWWGIAPTKLYNTWMVYDRNELTLRSLNNGQRYWFRVDSFNTNGVTIGKVISVA